MPINVMTCSKNTGYKAHTKAQESSAAPSSESSRGRGRQPAFALQDRGELVSAAARRRGGGAGRAEAHARGWQLRRKFLARPGGNLGGLPAATASALLRL